MAYDEALSKRIDQFIKNKKGFTRKEMFGGVGYLLHGNMCIGVHKKDLIIRYNPKLADEVSSKHVRPFDIAGRPMKGWGLVDSERVKGGDLGKWIDFSVEFVKSLPAKK